jgi:hypothetical protein
LNLSIAPANFRLLQGSLADCWNDNVAREGRYSYNESLYVSSLISIVREPPRAQVEPERSLHFRAAIRVLVSRCTDVIHDRHPLSVTQAKTAITAVKDRPLKMFLPQELGAEGLEQSISGTIDRSARFSIIAASVMNHSTDNPASVTVITVAIRAKCTASSCRNEARLILRYADKGGRQITQVELCFRHARDLLERNRAAGLIVFDNREA